MESEIDEGLYSRQLYALGKKAMQQLSKKKILISGMNGLGLEVAKNIILSGVNHVTLQDTEELSSMDLSSFFYGSIDDVGVNRAAACYKQLCELNHYVSVEKSDIPISEKMVSQYDVVVLCDARSNSRISQINEWCRRGNAKFILAAARGLFGLIFCDFGEDYVVLDVSGTEPEWLEVISVEQSADALVYVRGDKGHGFCDESLVQFTGLRGMEQLNDAEPIKVSINDYQSFYTGNTENYAPHISGTGLVREIFLPNTIHFKSYAHYCETLPESGEFIISDYSKLEHPKMLFICFYALNVYYEKYGEFPRSWNSADTLLFLELLQHNAARFSYTVKNEEIGRIFSYVCRGNLNPMHASIGGIVAQEVIKAASQQFTPICQWYLNDYMQCLATDCAATVDSDVYLPTDSRYDGQVAVFGSQFQEVLGSLRYFVIGAGAIGSELLKNLAMSGAAAGPSGELFVTDMDFIERSNLSRQFLFRDWHIGQPKSLTAAAAIALMNPATRLVAHTHQVGPDTESVYTNAFFGALHCVVNALDSVEARLYTASRVEFNGCPMLDSGTQGSQASQQVVLPGLTKSYRAVAARNTAIPSCTLKNFPYEIEHTIQWAKDLFTSYFCNTPRLAHLFIQDRPEFFKKISEMSPYQKFDTVSQVLGFFKAIPHSFEDCVVWALKEWFSLFSKAIQQILYSFPADAKTPEGLPFWSGTKRVPRFEDFDTSKSHHMDFIIATSKLRARLFRMEIETDENIKSLAGSFQFESFSPSSSAKIAVDDSEIDKLIDLELMNTRIQQLHALDFQEVLELDPQQFEKDDDSNFHIDFMTAASNMRAYNYRIEPADRMKTKKIAGNIIPALATTTSVIAGQVCLELFKLAQGHRDVLKYRDSYLNLASPVFTMTIPERARKYYVLGKCYTLWDKIDIQGDISLRHFLDLMRSDHDMEVCCVTYKTGVLFASWLDKAYRDEIYDCRMGDIIRNRIKQVICDNETVIPIYISVEDENGEDIEGLPLIRYHL